jgi:hypothetical protein
MCNCFLTPLFGLMTNNQRRMNYILSVITIRISVVGENTNNGAKNFEGLYSKGEMSRITQSTSVRRKNAR